MKKWLEGDIDRTINGFNNWAVRDSAIRQLMENQNDIIDWIISLHTDSTPFSVANVNGETVIVRHKQ